MTIKVFSRRHSSALLNFQSVKFVEFDRDYFWIVYHQTKYCENQTICCGVMIGLDCAVFYVPSNSVYVIFETVFTGQKTQPTVSKY